MSFPKEKGLHLLIALWERIDVYLCICLGVSSVVAKIATANLQYVKKDDQGFFISKSSCEITDFCPILVARIKEWFGNTESHVKSHSNYLGDWNQVF